ncbi:MAG: GAF domain-containing sensor histidine kinase [Rhizomicrobium sp.]
MAAGEDDFKTDIAALGRIDAVPRILEVVCRTTGMGFAAVARVTEERWIACAVHDEIAFGLKPGGELKIQTTICNEIRASGQGVIIDEVAADAAYRDHATPAMYGFQSYISLPIVRADGTFFGTLCAIDPKPARLNRPEIVEMFRLFADLVAFHLDAQERVDRTQAALLDERQTSELREQFIAVLGHDLRNPLAAIGAGARLLRGEALSARGAEVVGLLQNSVSRMAGLIDNVLDFARGRLGGGLSLDRGEAPLAPALEQVVNELRSAWPDRAIELSFAPMPQAGFDAARIAQLLSNLVANALIHGDPQHPVRIAAGSDGAVFELSVSNAGAPIAPHMQARLFQPFFRIAVRRDAKGLGLGLYIAAEIAKAHGGTLAVDSTERATRFTFRAPVPPGGR